VSLEEGKKIYFASDVHLGAAGIKDKRAHEKRFVNWLDSIKDTAGEIYLMGDIFDFWFEYKRVVPRGYTRLLGKLSELTDQGIPVHFFCGNHDLWAFDYLSSECGVKLYHHPVVKRIGGKTFYLAHGDGLGSYDQKYNLLKILFTSRFMQWCFARLHPNFGIGWATSWSTSSRKKNMKYGGPDYLGDDKEWLVLHAKDEIKKNHIDYFVFGHRHLVKVVEVAPNSHVFHLGDWIQHFSYAEFDGETLELKFSKK